VFVMNRYGQLAQEHWRRWLPTRYAEIPDPVDFFSTLGQEAEDQVFDLRDQLAGPDLPGEGYLEKVGRLNMAQLQAEEAVLADLVYLPPEPEVQDQDEQDLLSDPVLAGTRQMLAMAQQMERLRLQELEEQDY